MSPGNDMPPPPPTTTNHPADRQTTITHRSSATSKCICRCHVVGCCCCFANTQLFHQLVCILQFFFANCTASYCYTHVGCVFVCLCVCVCVCLWVSSCILSVSVSVLPCNNRDDMWSRFVSFSVRSIRWWMTHNYILNLKTKKKQIYKSTHCHLPKTRTTIYNHNNRNKISKWN